jgi:hypothetical protein
VPTAPGPIAVAAQQPELPLASSLNGPDPPGAALARLDAARAQLAGYQGNADRIAAAAYMGGRADDVNAILTAASPQTLIDNLAIQRTMASQMSEQMRVFRRLDGEAQAMAVLTEELGHHLDELLNAVDTPGDEDD